jgi:hypothetical protein
LLKKVPSELDKYVIDKELQHTEDFIFTYGLNPGSVSNSCSPSGARAGLTLRQNKHVLRASRIRGHHKNPATRQFILLARY